MHVLVYIPWLIKEIFVSGFQLAWHAIKPQSGFDPVVVYYPLRVESQWELFWFSTSITVTPGTLSFGFREPKEPGAPRILLVQAVLGSDPADVVAGLADMEARLAPRVREIDHGVPGQGSAEELSEEFYSYPDSRRKGGEAK
ncbi:cation:proton antiporter [Corynebacterium atypicum]|uniref:Cation:proton antiporter n=1 Tax=Corynebacterium atypicum TaxID=191610 RepID=A0ABM5QL40_9CORY|nr:monovalent cation/H+ antiporter subunit E [Corynebacterium atypicum]AIG63481.1 cation:proton antiporter [Corynebacterium atypicum]